MLLRKLLPSFSGGFTHHSNPYFAVLIPLSLIPSPLMHRTLYFRDQLTVAKLTHHLRNRQISGSPVTNGSHSLKAWKHYSYIEARISKKMGRDDSEQCDRKRRNGIKLPKAEILQRWLIFQAFFLLVSSPQRSTAIGHLPGACSQMAPPSRRKSQWVSGILLFDTPHPPFPVACYLNTAHLHLLSVIATRNCFPALF